MSPVCCDECKHLATATCTDCPLGDGPPTAPLRFRPYEQGDDE